MAGYEIVEHPADIGFRFWSDNLDGAFNQALKALTWMLAGDNPVRPRTAVTINLKSPDRLALLFDFLSEVLYYYDAEQLIFEKAEFQHLSETELNATLYGEQFDPDRNTAPYYVKAITYHQIKLAPSDGGWEGIVYVDI